MIGEIRGNDLICARPWREEVVNKSSNESKMATRESEPMIRVSFFTRFNTC